MDNWDEVKTALYVARLGTVSGAAEVLGVHHATVIRHIDALEERLGVKLFQRHPRGYSATEAGKDLYRVAQTAQEQFTQFASRARGLGDSVSGELVVTTLSVLTPKLNPMFASFLGAYPDINLRILSDERVFKLEYGEAHLAIRLGRMPDDPDNIVIPLGRFRNAIYGSPEYFAAHGKPQSEEDLARHMFVMQIGDSVRAPFERWLHGLPTPPREVMQTTSITAHDLAIQSGVGLGFLSQARAAELGLELAIAEQAEWGDDIWLVTHMDLHKMTKLQAMIQHIRKWAKENWS
jgi:DNA-binding transcriptional LysR family regulator